MSFSDPRTWVTGELVTASLLNVQLRDQLDAVIEGTTGAYVNAVTGPHAIGGSTVDYVRLGLTGAFTSGGASTLAFGVYTSGVLTGHSGDSAAIAGIKANNSIVTAGNCTTIAQLWVSEPQITVGAGSVTNSATVYIESSASEASNDFALWVDAGATQLDGTLDVGGATTLDSTLGVVGAATFNNAGADVDLRVETSGDEYAFTINGGTNNVGIGEADPGHKFTVSGTGGTQGALAGFDTSAEKIANLQSGGAADADRRGNLQIWGTNTGANDSIALGSTGSSNVDMLFATRRADGVCAVNLHLTGDGTNINGAGMTFNAETAAANTLDDYEEGTWSPVPNGSSGSAGAAADNMAGKYTKVGRLVVATCYGYMSNLGSWSGDMQVSGLPFTHAAGTASYGSIGNFPDGTSSWRTVVFPAGGTVINFRKGLNMDVVVPFSDWAGTGIALSVTISYYA